MNLRYHARRALLLAAITTTALAAPARADWQEAKSVHFTVYGNMAASDLRERTLRLEKFDAALRGLFGVTTTDAATIYFVGSTDEIQKLAGRANVAGFYRDDAQGPVGFIPIRLPNAIRGLSTEQVMFHEYTHHMLRTNTIQFYPGWVTEGLAELFSSARFDANGAVVFGAPIENRGYAINGLSHWTARQLIESDTKPPKEDEHIELYSRGWLLCHYLLISGKRPGQFFKYINALNAGKPPLEAASVFGDLDKLEGELEVYLRGRNFPSSVMAPDKLKFSSDVAVRPLDAAEAAIMPYRMTSANGVNEKNVVTLAEKARPVAALYPDSVFVQRTMAEIEHDAKAYDAADAAAARALVLDPANVMAMIYRGRVAARRAVKENSPERWREARRWFLGANKLNPDYALPFILFYDSFGAAGQPVPEGAANGIYRAAVLAPADTGVRVRAAMALIRAGDIKIARTTLVPLALDPHVDTKNPYAKLVLAMDEGKDKDALLAKAKELKLDGVNDFLDPPKDDKDKKAADPKGGEAKDPKGGK